MMKRFFEDENLLSSKEEVKALERKKAFVTKALLISTN